MVADNLEKVQMRGERIDELDERAGWSYDCVSNMLWAGLINLVGGAVPSYPPLIPLATVYCAVVQKCFECTFAHLHTQKSKFQHARQNKPHLSAIKHA